MDGDLCPLPEILDLSEQFEAMVLVDEAHGTGVIGEGGAGCVEYFGCTGRPLIQMGTLSKAIGSLGGYVTGSFPLIDFLRNRCPSWIYTTGLSPADTAAALAAVRIIEIEPERRCQLWQNVQAVKNNLYHWSQITSQRYKLLPSQSPILCIEMPNSQITQQIGSQLQALGLWVAAIRPPTTPTCRLRITLMSTHTSHHCEQLSNALTSLCY
jgi:8-amino-7-oxononanoate synthase